VCRLAAFAPAEAARPPTGPVLMVLMVLSAASGADNDSAADGEAARYRNNVSS
jgi:hypothetical protein